MKRMLKFIHKIIDKLTHKNEWQLNLYFNDQLVKTLYVPESEQPFSKFYIITVRGKKHLFGTNRRVTIVAKPMLLKYTDKEHMKVHIEIECFKGVRAYEQ